MTTYTEHEIAPVVDLSRRRKLAAGDELPIHPMEAIFEAFHRIHAAATGQSNRTYMSIPANPKRDADLILLSALDELERRRDEANDPRAALTTAVERIADFCQLMRLQDDLRLVELGRRLEEDLQTFHRVLAATAPPAP